MVSRDHQLRKIQESAASAGATAVSTAEELADAVTKGVEHIELRNHLDLTNWNKGEDTILGFLPKTVKSMRVCHHYMFISTFCTASD